MNVSSAAPTTSSFRYLHNETTRSGTLRSVKPTPTRPLTKDEIAHLPHSIAQRCPVRTSEHQTIFVKQPTLVFPIRTVSKKSQQASSPDISYERFHPEHDSLHVEVPFFSELTLKIIPHRQHHLDDDKRKYRTIPRHRVDRIIFNDKGVSVVNAKFLRKLKSTKRQRFRQRDLNPETIHDVTIDPRDFRIPDNDIITDETLYQELPFPRNTTPQSDGQARREAKKKGNLKVSRH
ncbi:acetyl-CoA synthetase I [Striga asiatica]|uniref:Acetyl-CoA synthetase I n=1 Tax=Striga asiatica TaxID=4170 RepID=A0A5A7QRL4_STRAF|nr:acetyl-CoA synthetase I [Striga asiatica]